MNGMPAFLAYNHPNTVQNVFLTSAPVLTAIGSAILFLLWPFRWVFYSGRRYWRQLAWPGRLGITLLALACLGGIGWSTIAGIRLLTRPAAIATADVIEPSTVNGGAQRFERVIVLGVDGLDPEVMEGMMATGKLPNFHRLSNEGTFSRLATSTPPASPVAWSTMATGVGPGEHGVFDFLHRDAGEYTPKLSLREASGGWLQTRYRPARERPGFWAYTSRAGIPTTVIRWPVSFPAEQVTGRFLSGFGVPDLRGGEGSYTFFTSGTVEATDPGKHHIVELKWNGEAASVELKGPSTGENRYSMSSLQIKRLLPDRIEISSLESANAPASVEVPLERWSDWLPLSFSVGAGRQVHGAIKFYLVELEPNLKLVASPIHMDAERQAYALTWPEEFGAELQARLGRFHTLGMPEQLQPVTDRRYGPEAYLAECRSVMQERRAMLDLELKRFDRGLLAFVFDTSDRLQHAFWATRDPQHPAYQEDFAQHYAHVIEHVYLEMDEILGDVLKQVDANTALLLVSDHGFSSFRRAVHVNRWLIENGFMHLQASDGNVGSDLFRDVDWQRTEAYAYGFASISLNLATRERLGTVDAVSEYRPTCERLAAALRQWRDPDSGEAIVHDVYLAADLFPGPMLNQRGPDLIVALRPGYRFSWETAVGGAPLASVEDNLGQWTGDHLIDASFVPGVLFSNRRLQVSQPTQLDICPTVLSCFGLSAPPEFRGRVLF